MTFPSYLFPLKSLENIQVIGDVREKTDYKTGEQKTVDWFGSVLFSWTVSVEVVRGIREKVLPSGEKLTVFDTEKMNITVHRKEKPSIENGDYVYFSDVAFGAMEGKIFIQALDVTRLDDEFLLNFEEKK